MQRRNKSQYLSLVLYKTYAELRAESARTYIGFLWWIIEPIVDMATYYLVFAVLLRNRTEDYVPFLLIGLVSWKWFNVSVMMGADSISKNIPLMRQAYIPKTLFPLVTTLKNTVKFAVSFVMLLVFLWFYGFTPGSGHALLPALIVVQFVFGLGCAFVVAAIVPLVPDLTIILTNAMRLMFFLSGIFYSADRIPEEYRSYFYLNPMARLIAAYRDALMVRGPLAADELLPILDRLTGIAIAAVLLLLLGWLLLRSLDRTYPRLPS